MLSSSNLQLQASTGKVVSPTILTDYGFDVSVTYTSVADFTLTVGTSTKTASSVLTVGTSNTSTTFTIAANSKYGTISKIVITPKTAPVSTSISAAGYATLYYGDKNLIVPEGVEAYTIFTDGDELLYNTTYKAGDVIPATEGVLLKGAAGNYDFITSSVAGEKDSDNMLRGSDEAALTTGGDLYYGLSLNASSELSSVGFYWMATDGAAFTNGAHKAYLALSTSTPNKAPRAFRFIEDDATGIASANVETAKANGMYNLAGQKVSSDFRGIVIMNYCCPIKLFE